eukprot:jgi/Galph1/4831/GphlegSOOS_G3415.1
MSTDSQETEKIQNNNSIHNRHQEKKSTQVSLLSSFKPLEFINELFQTVDNVLCDTLDSLKLSLDEKGYPSQYEQIIREGIESFQEKLVEESDFQFDLFELYVLYNVFRIPANLHSLPPFLNISQENLDNNSQDLLSNVDNELFTLGRDIRSLLYARKCMKEELVVLNCDLASYSHLKPIVEEIVKKTPSALSEEQLCKVMALVSSVSKGATSCEQVKQELEQTYLSSMKTASTRLDPSLKLDISNASLADIQKMTSTMRYPQ